MKPDPAERIAHALTELRETLEDLAPTAEIEKAVAALHGAREALNRVASDATRLRLDARDVLTQLDSIEIWLRKVGA